MSSMIDSPKRTYPKRPMVKYIAAHNSSEILTTDIISEGLLSSDPIG